MSSVGHMHHGKDTVYRDFCHYTQVETACIECGQTVIKTTSRDFDGDAMQVAFADPNCETCRDLLKGRWPESWNGVRAGR